MQGLLLAGVWIAVWIVLTIVGVAFGIGTSFVPGAGGGLASAGGGLILLVIRFALGIALLAISIMGMMKANSGEMWKLPVIGDIAEKNA